MDDALWKWMKTPEAQKIATSAQEKAWNELQQQFPRADRSKFEIQTDFTKTHKATAEVFFKDNGGLTSVFGSDRRYWSQQMKTALGEGDVNGLSPLKTKKPLPIPAVDFTEPVSSIKKNLCRPDKNLRHARLFLSGEIKRNIRTDKVTP